MTRAILRTLAVAVIAPTLMLTSCVQPTPQEDPQETATPTTDEPLPPEPNPLIAVKVDNVAAARPQTGIGDAHIVIVEPVEAGLTRLLAVFEAPLPEVVGPVRSARITDLDLLRLLGEPTFAYSGAANEVLDRFRDAPLINATEGNTPGAFFRDNRRSSPHNLYVRPGLLPQPSEPPAGAVLAVGESPLGGEITTGERVDYGLASYAITWDSDKSAWTIDVDSRPLSTTDSGNIVADTVVLQEVDIRPGLLGSPEARTTGSGAVTVLRDGERHVGQWRRTRSEDPLLFFTSAGEPLTVAEGTTWIFLVPSA
ncbi:DUF3048 domain-containing protein [Hoyosella rhizosphaerae]|uniref:DUF3048 domain-containing protein n=1 Tax=Hoyosella rhizosphaerae TaxID=1755582 RepID=A0A916U3A2_9ACTN|nr:DUF3048 domain-containing protein [Hoyosella rhizosphaerae]MBN4926627.1 DUF3048 domain-containing protein [Hoyosella rhizosphaerae]GGC57717.1 hypothetical protein GCM10011410_07810 [Hoyosella rhizosphaerae]